MSIRARIARAGIRVPAFGANDDLLPATEPTETFPERPLAAPGSFLEPERVAVRGVEEVAARLSEGSVQSLHSRPLDAAAERAEAVAERRDVQIGVRNSISFDDGLTGSEETVR